MNDGNPLPALESIADSLKRLADHFCPVEERREKRPATLSTAVYDPAERERQEFREALGKQEPQPEGRIATAIKGRHRSP